MPRLALALALVPLVVSAVALVVEVGSDYFPAGDVAGIELRVRDVGRHPVLTGLFSREGWNHPGPALFYLLALPYRLTGSASIGLNLGALLINGLAIAGMAWVAKRRGGTPLMLLTLVGCGLLVRSLGPHFVRDVWNPLIPVLPFGLFLFLVWELTCGETWALPVAAGVASFIVQTHIGYVPLALPLLVWGAMWLAVLARRRRRPRPAAVARAYKIAAVVLCVMWLPPLVETFVHWPGNLGEIAQYFLRDADQQHHTLAEGYGLMSGQFGLRPEWLTGVREVNFFTGEPDLLRSAPAPVWLVPFMLGAFVLGRRRRPDAGRLVAIVGLALCLGMLWVASTLGPVYDYRLGWTWVVTMAAFLVVVWATWVVTVDRAPRIEARLLAPVCLAALVGLAGVNAADAARAGTPKTFPSHLASLMPSIIRALPERDGDVVVGCSGDTSCIDSAGLFLRLERMAIRVRADASYGLIGSDGPWRVHRTGPVRAALRVGVDESFNALAVQPRLRLVAYWGTIPRGERVRAARRSAEVDAAHEAGALDDIAWYYERVGLSRQLRPAVGVFSEPLRNEAAPTPPKR